MNTSFYPPGFSPFRSDSKISFYCNFCEDVEWEGRLFYELGAYFLYREEDVFCPHCGRVGKEV